MKWKLHGMRDIRSGGVIFVFGECQQGSPDTLVSVYIGCPIWVTRISSHWSYIYIYIQGHIGITKGNTKSLDYRSYSVKQGFEIGISSAVPHIGFPN